MVTMFKPKIWAEEWGIKEKGEGAELWFSYCFNCHETAESNLNKEQITFYQGSLFYEREEGEK